MFIGTLSIRTGRVARLDETDDYACATSMMHAARRHPDSALSDGPDWVRDQPCGSGSAAR